MSETAAAQVENQVENSSASPEKKILCKYFKDISLIFNCSSINFLVKS